MAIWRKPAEIAGFLALPGFPYFNGATAGHQVIPTRCLFSIKQPLPLPRPIAWLAVLAYIGRFGTGAKDNP